MSKFFQFALPAFLSVALFGATVFFFILPRMEHAVMDTKREAIRELVRTVEDLLKTYQADVAEGALDLHEAQRRALQRIKTLRYGIDTRSYYWVISFDRRLLTHPYRSDLVDRDFNELTDPVVKNLINDVVRTATELGGGYVNYVWPNPNNPKENLPKIAYVSPFEPWGWIIGSGLYYDDAQHEIARLTHSLTLVGMGILALVALLSAYLTWRGMLVMRENEKMLTSLHHSEAKFRGMSASAHDGIVMIESDGLVSFWNKAAETIFGYNEEEMIGKDLHDILATKNQYQSYSTAVQRFRSNGTGKAVGKTIELIALKKDGSNIPIELSVSAMNLYGKWHAVGVVRDVSERKNAEVARVESLELLRATLNATPDGIIVVNKQRRVTHVNRQFYQMWHIPEALQTTDDEQSLLSFVLDQLKNPDEFLAEVNALYKSELTDFEEIHFKDGRVFERYSSPVILGDKEVGRVWDLRDVTERKRTEEERTKLQSQLFQSQKMEAVGILAGGVAHDFNNMLGAIIGYAELLMQGMDSGDPIRKNLAKILDAGQRSASLTRQLLAFARKQAVSPVVFDLNGAVEDLLKMLRRLIGENIELAWLPAKTACIVTMDPSQLDQILANLCVNARDAIANVGRLSIKTETVFKDEFSCKAHVDCVPGDYVMLSVSDNGCGMEKETADHIFEPFFTTKKLGHGTGLGLATVYGIVKQNKGFINLYSELGDGTTFNIYLPRHGTQPAIESAESAHKIPRSRGETILLVEDDPTLLEMGLMMLQRLGYTVLSAAAPSEAVRLVEDVDIKLDLFITDVVMPEMNGRELAERLMAIRPDMKHLFMSGYTADIIAHQGVLDEGVNFISKPFTLKELSIKIRRVLDQG